MNGISIFEGEETQEPTWPARSIETLVRMCEDTKIVPEWATYRDIFTLGVFSRKELQVLHEHLTGEIVEMTHNFLNGAEQWRQK